MKKIKKNKKQKLVSVGVEPWSLDILLSGRIALQLSALPQDERTNEKTKRRKDFFVFSNEKVFFLFAQERQQRRSSQLNASHQRK